MINIVIWRREKRGKKLKSKRNWRIIFWQLFAVLLVPTTSSTQFFLIIDLLPIVQLKRLSIIQRCMCATIIIIIMMNSLRFFHYSKFTSVINPKPSYFTYICSQTWYILAINLIFLCVRIIKWQQRFTSIGKFLKRLRN